MHTRKHSPVAMCSIAFANILSFQKVRYRFSIELLYVCTSRSSLHDSRAPDDHATSRLAPEWGVSPSISYTANRHGPTFHAARCYPPRCHLSTVNTNHLYPASMLVMASDTLFRWCSRAILPSCRHLICGCYSPLHDPPFLVVVSPSYYLICLPLILVPSCYRNHLGFSAIFNMDLNYLNDKNKKQLFFVFE